MVNILMPKNSCDAGTFPEMVVVCSQSTAQEMYNSILVDTPLGVHIAMSAARHFARQLTLHDLPIGQSIMF